MDSRFNGDLLRKLRDLGAGPKISTNTAITVVRGILDRADQLSYYQDDEDCSEKVHSLILKATAILMRTIRENRKDHTSSSLIDGGKEPAFVLEYDGMSCVFRCGNSDQGQKYAQEIVEEELKWMLPELEDGDQVTISKQVWEQSDLDELPDFEGW